MVTSIKIYRSRIAESKGTKLFSREVSLLKPSAALVYDGAFHQTLTNTVLSSVFEFCQFHKGEIESPCFYLHFPYEEHVKYLNFLPCELFISLPIFLKAVVFLTDL